MQVGQAASHWPHKPKRRVRIPHLLPLFVSLASCSALKPLAGHVTDKPGLSDAQMVVWRDVYGRSDASPLVFLVEEPTCTDPNSSKPGFDCPTIGCRNGCTASPVAVHVSYSGQKWSETTLAHEDMHAKKMRQAIELLKYSPTAAILQQLGDRDHGGPEWQPGGDVDKANQRLREFGL